MLVFGIKIGEEIPENIQNRFLLLKSNDAGEFFEGLHFTLCVHKNIKDGPVFLASSKLLNALTFFLPSYLRKEKGHYALNVQKVQSSLENKIHPLSLKQKIKDGKEHLDDVVKKNQFNSPLIGEMRKVGRTREIELERKVKGDILGDLEEVRPVPDGPVFNGNGWVEVEGCEKYSIVSDLLGLVGESSWDNEDLPEDDLNLMNPMREINPDENLSSSSGYQDVYIKPTLQASTHQETHQLQELPGLSQSHVFPNEFCSLCKQELRDGGQNIFSCNFCQSAYHEKCAIKLLEEGTATCVVCNGSWWFE
ncbi:MAG: PHD finger domain-containing protein [Promethearchaeota archaeon]